MLLSEMMKTRLARQANVCVEDKLPVIDLLVKDEELGVLIPARETQVSHGGGWSSPKLEDSMAAVAQFRIMDWLSRTKT